MKLQYLGTSAAEAVPALFCCCPTCTEARKLGGKNIRSRSQALLDDTLLIDFPADTLWHTVKFGINLLDIEAILITHVHEDHYYPKDFWNLREPNFAHTPPDWKGLTLYGGANVREVAGIYGGKDLNELNPKFRFVPVKAFLPFTEGKYTITPLKANHGAESPFIYLISDGEKTLFYVHDSGVLPDETMEYLATNRPHIDMISMDCTYGADMEKTKGGHMGLGNNLSLLSDLEQIGCVDKKTVKAVNHFSHNGKSINYDEMSQCTEQYGILTSFDGMTVTF